MVNKTTAPLTNDLSQRLASLVRLRIPWLIFGLLGGVIASFLISRFEGLLLDDIRLAFFVPMIVYMSDAVGTQSETIFVRYLKDHKINFIKYLIKELSLGLNMGLVLGLLIGLIVHLWLGSLKLTLIVGLTMTINVTLAPAIAITVSEILYQKHTDPALGAGPFATVIQDFVSLLTFFLIASAISLIIL